MLYMNLQVSVKRQKRAVEATLHGRDIWWKLLVLVSPLLVQLSGAMNPRSSPELLPLPLGLRNGFLADEEFSAHLVGDGQPATQRQPEIFKLCAGI